MRLRELMTAIAKAGELDWIIDGVPMRGTPWGFDRLRDGTYHVTVQETEGWTKAIRLHADPSPTNDPLDAELR